MNRADPLVWLLAGVGVGLVAALTTRWYVGLLAFALIALETTAGFFVYESTGGRPLPQ